MSYRLETVARACRVLRCFEEAEPLRLADVVARTGLNKSIVFRIIRTLEEAGFLRNVGNFRYQSGIRITSGAKLRLGYAAQAENSQFSSMVTDSLRRAAAREQIDLIVLDNRYSARTALRNAQRLIAERVDLVFEFQTFERVAPAISALFQEAGIPLIAIEIPHPGATFYGVNNYRVGLSAGRTLARWAKRCWGGEVEAVILLELPIAGALPQLRLEGAEAGIREVLPGVPAGDFVHIDARGDFDCALEGVRKYLRRAPAGRTLIVGVNDPCALGALRAFEEARPFRVLRRNRSWGHPGWQGRAAPDRVAAHRFGGVFSGALRRRPDPPGAGYPRKTAYATSGLCAPAPDYCRQSPQFLPYGPVILPYWLVIWLRKRVAFHDDINR
ncbi:MAG TPA: helix-turn-helix domain-containing protein [Bryobacteraceae bacterium]|nr:helix-turn-helix domain-containing protein [Bryobacteraceae bacterium]